MKVIGVTLRELDDLKKAGNSLTQDELARILKQLPNELRYQPTQQVRFQAGSPANSIVKTITR